jgi:enoyl-CoA hydratase/carnithine racemase
MPELILRREGAVATVVFSNLAKHNAMTLDMWRRLPELMSELDRDAAVRVIVLAGDGDKAFISGADISQFEKDRSTADAQALYNAAVEAAYECPTQISKPVIAKIRGICMGGGLGLAAACDLRFAAEDAVFRMPAARLGLGYNFVGLQRFVNVLGAANTADIFFSARKFDARDALQMGFVGKVLPIATFDQEIDAYCAMVAESAPMTLAAAKFTIRQVMRDAAERDLKGVDQRVKACFASEDYVEGRRAFAQKRAPKFQGR